jgi:hypothetical protein
MMIKVHPEGYDGIVSDILLNGRNAQSKLGKYMYIYIFQYKMGMKY